MNVSTHLELKAFRSFLLRYPSGVIWLVLGGIGFVVSCFELRAIGAFRRAAALCKAGHGMAGEMPLSLDKLPDVRFKLYAGPLPKDAEIKLATQNIKITSDINWSHPYRDQEDSFALNRFGWLLSTLLRYPSPIYAQIALKNILSWISQKEDVRGGLAWESYSIAERLANWPFILLIIKKMIPIPADALSEISKSMNEQLDHLINNLEYRGRFTNNHLLNDARGLYVSGIVLNNERARQKGREIFLSWTKKTFYPDGMLKDGSSHYQYLLCQRYEQVYYLSRHVNDQPFADFMQQWVLFMRESCKFFCVYGEDHSWAIPMFGDISPDFPPQWFAPHEKAGWEELKVWLNWTLPSDDVNEKREGACDKGDFIRFDAGRVTVFWHIDRDKSGYLNHGHYDLGSFVFFYNGIQIFADPGRFSYEAEHVFTKSAKAHSSLLLDSLGPLCEVNKLNLVNVYRSIKTGFSVVRSEECLTLLITCEGFKRLSVPVQWSRRFSVYSDKMTIVDNLESAGHNILECRFQMSPGLEVKEVSGGFSIYHTQNVPIRLAVMDPFEYKCKLISGSNADTDGGWVSSEYGVGRPATTVVFQRDLSGVKTYVYEIRWQDVS
ncbi:MAG: heparinase II/III family protein [Candidatus Omnitrophica bacterium]|nr:heparinase II/III family protein [Candidatus Omnitrophota bacterium]